MDKPRGRHHGLSQQKKQEIKEAFELFDIDGSGIQIASLTIHIMNTSQACNDLILFFSLIQALLMPKS